MEVDEAVRRAKLIVPMLRHDVETAIASHAVMEACNDIVPLGMNGTMSDFNDVYGIAQNALTLKLAMDIARIFDLGLSARHPPETQDKASVQVLAALLARADVQRHFEREAEGWLLGVEYVGPEPLNTLSPEVLEVMRDIETGHRATDRESCGKAISDFLEVASRLSVDGSDEQAAICRVRDFRNRRLAHSLFDKEPDTLPMYSDLHLLLSVAMSAARHASMAVEGRSTELDEQADRQRKAGEGYAACLLAGLTGAATRRDF